MTTPAKKREVKVKISKALIFDMDGTIADLYSVENWLPKLMSEDVSPYSEAAPIYGMDTMKVILNLFRDLGYRIMIVSWGAKEASKNYSSEIRKAKIAWLDKYGFPYDEVHIIKYGTPKQRFIKDDLSILIDDSDEVRASFLKSKRGKERQVIDAKRNVLEALVNLLVAV